MRMTPNRRQFVASLATLPLAGMPLVVASASTQQPRAAPDPVLQQILSDLRALVAEGDAQPSARKSAARAIDTTLGVLAAHVGAHYDSALRSALRRREAKLGRTALVEELVASAQRRRHTVSYDEADKALTLLSDAGLAGGVRELQRAWRALRLNAPDAVQRATLRGAQYDYCADLRGWITWTEIYMGYVCYLAPIEPSPALEAACAAAGLMFANLTLAYWWWC
jgi:hypothetical protein